MSDDKADAKTVFGEIPAEDDGGGTTLGSGDSLATRVGPRVSDQTLAYFSSVSPVVASSIERPMPVVAGYEILGELGRGAVGVVYHARQVRLNRPCALKMILAGEHTGAEAALRFLVEAEAVARLQHPNVIQIHNLGESGGLPFVELEYAPGGSLDKQLDGVPWAARAAARTVEALARGVAEAHRLGIVHRDLKPGNILIGADGTPKVADFGLAKSVGADSGLTRTESVLGSPSYMSPEQAEGKNHLVGPAADVYSLGAILYELVTGRPPFRGTNVLDTLAQVKSVEPVSPTRLAPGLSKDLETITLKCLQKEPARRYETAKELAADLTRWLDGETIAARPSPFWERAWKSARRRPLQAAMVAMAILLVSAMLGVWGWSYAKIGEALEVARLDRLKAESAKVESDRLAASEASARAESTRRSAALALDKGVLLAEAGRVGRGMLWINRAYESAAGLDEPLRRAARANLADWGRRASRPRRVVELNKGTYGLRSRPDVNALVIGTDGGPTVLDLSTLEPRFTPPQGMDWKVNAVVTQDGRSFFASDGGRAFAWDLASGAPIGQFPTVSPVVHPDSMSVDPSGDRAALIDYTNGKLWVWDRTGKEPRARSVQPEARYGQAAFSHDGRLVAAVGEDGVLRTWDTRTLVAGFSAKVEGDRVEFLPGGFGLVVCGGPASKVAVWDIGAARPRFERSIGSAISGLSFRPDGRAILVGARDGSIRLLDAATGDSLAPIIHGETPVMTSNRGNSGGQGWFGVLSSVTLSPDGQAILSTHEDATARTWDLATGRPIGSIMEHPGGLVGAAFGADGRTAITVTATGQIFEWDLADAPIGRTMAHRSGLDLETGVISPDGRLVVSVGHLHNYALIVDVATGLPRSSPLLHDGQTVRDAQFSPDGRLVATCGNDGQVRLWDFDGRPTGRTMQMPHWVTRFLFTADGRTIVAIDAVFNLRSWDVTTGELIDPDVPMDRSAHHSYILPCPDGLTFLTMTEAGGVWRRDARTLKPIGDLITPASLAALDQSDIRSIRPFGFSPDGSTCWLGEWGHQSGMRVVRRDSRTWRTIGPPLARDVEGFTLVSGGRRLLIHVGTTARFLDSATGVQIGSAMEHPSPVRSMKLSPDGSTIATGAEDGGLRFWDSATGRPIGPPRPHPGPVTAIQFLGDDRVLTFIDIPTLWEVPRPTVDNPAWISAEVQSVSSMKLDDAGDGTHRLAPSAWRSLRVKTADTGVDAADWHERLATRFAIRGPVSAAIWHLDRLLTDRPDDVAALLRRASIRADGGDEAGSNEDLSKAAAIDPGLAEAWRLWRLYDRMGSASVPASRMAGALADLDLLLASRPNEGTYLNRRIALLIRLGRAGDALRDLDRLISARPEVLNYRVRRADLLLREDRKSPAMTDFRELARLQPDAFEYQDRIGLLSLDFGDLPGYRQSCLEVLSQLPAKPSAVQANNAAWFMVVGEGPDPDRAVALAAFALVGLSENRRRGTINTLGVALYRAGRYPEAVAQLSESVRLSGGAGDPEDWAFLALSYHRLNDPTTARRWLDRLRAWTPVATRESYWNDLQASIVRREAIAVILLDPAFPDEVLIPSEK